MKRSLVPILLALVACTPKPAPPPPANSPATLAVAKGVVEAQGGLLRVLAPRDGVLTAQVTDEGVMVAAGQVLAQLDSRQTRLLLDAAVADLGERRAQAEVAAARAAGAEREARRLAALAAADATPRMEAEQAATAAAVSRGEHRQAVESLRAAEARQRLSAFELDVRTVRAPIAGRVVRRTATQGGYVAAATPLFVIEPTGARLVRAELDEAFADRVTQQTRAVVTREYQRGRSYPAQVLRVSDLLAGPALVDEAAARADARVVSVILSLPPTADLRLGQRVLVRFNR